MSVIGECLIAFVFGSVVGLLVQRSRFCNTSALRDAMLFKTFRNTKPLLIAMIILTFGFTLFLTFGEGKAMHFDVGLNQVVGLFLFGIGMVLAERCCAPGRCPPRKVLMFSPQYSFSLRPSSRSGKFSSLNRPDNSFRKIIKSERKGKL